jgi:hypothetical protein
MKNLFCIQHLDYTPRDTKEGIRQDVAAMIREDAQERGCDVSLRARGTSGLIDYVLQNYGHGAASQRLAQMAFARAAKVVRLRGQDVGIFRNAMNATLQIRWRSMVIENLSRSAA